MAMDCGAATRLGELGGSPANSSLGGSLRGRDSKRRAMSCPLSPIAGLAPGEDGFDLRLLQQAQAYLTCRSQRLAPDRPLLAAWEQFYRTYSPLIQSYALACRVPLTDLDDCVQQIWTDLVRKLSTFCYDSCRGQFRSWLYTLVRSRVTDLLRYTSRRRMTSLSFVALATLRGRDGDPAALHEQQSQQALVQQVLAELRRQVSACNYRVLHLRWIEGRSNAEIAAALGLAPASVRFRAHRMMQKFRRLFDLHADGEQRAERCAQVRGGNFQKKL